MTQCASRVVVADQQSLCRGGLASLISERLAIPAVTQAGDFAHTLAALARFPETALVTVNPNLPEMRGMIGLRRIRTDYSQVRLVVIADRCERELVLEALCAGVHGYIVKDTPTDEIVRALNMVLAGHIYVPALVSDLDVAPAEVRTPAGQVALTERQLEVLRLVAAGRSNKEIARALHIAEGTVKVHVTAAFRALGVHNRVSAAAALQLQPRNDNRGPAIGESMLRPFSRAGDAQLPLWN